MNKVIDRLQDDEQFHRHALIDEIDYAIRKLERLKEKCNKVEQLYDSDSITNANEINAHLNKCIVYQRTIINMSDSKKG